MVTTPSVTTVDSWLERAWLQAVEAGRLPPLRLLTPQQDLAVWQQLIRDDLEERLGFSLTHPRAAAQRAQAALNKLVSHGGNELSDLWSAFRYDEDCQIFSDWALRHRSRLDELGGISRYGAYQQLLSVSATERPSVGLFAVPELPPLTLRALHIWRCSSDRATQTIMPNSGSILATHDDELCAAPSGHSSNDEPGRRVGIVLLDMANDRNRLEYFLRQEFGCLDARYNDLPVNFATGMTLASTPMFRDARPLWNGKYALNREQWLSLARSPYLAFKGDLQTTAGLIQAQFLSGSHEISLENGLHIATRESPRRG